LTLKLISFLDDKKELSVGLKPALSIVSSSTNFLGYGLLPNAKELVRDNELEGLVDCKLGEDPSKFRLDASKSEGVVLTLDKLC